VIGKCKRKVGIIFGKSSQYAPEKSVKKPNPTGFYLQKAQKTAQTQYLVLEQFEMHNMHMEK